MKRLQAFKFELMPDGGQERSMRQFAGACRFVFNKALALQKANYEAGGKYINYIAMAKHLTSWRQGQDEPWLKDAPIHPLQHALKDLDRAYQLHIAAINILERGHRLLACAEDVRRVRAAKPKHAASMKQEPTEVTTNELSHA